MSEDDRVARLRAILGAQISPAVTLGIGDDAAVLEGSLVWTIDAQIEGTHFRRAWLPWEDVGYRSVMAAASDLGAMGAEPLGALASLVLAPDVDDAAFDAIARGQAEAAREVGAPVIGGNLARGTETSLTTTWVGRSAAPITRSGAKPGDALYVAGALGLAAAGLRALETRAAIEDAILAWRRPRARIGDGLALRGRAHAAIDVSDGLSRDALHIARASGVAVVVDEQALRDHGGEALARAATTLNADVLDLLLHGGEDYALLAASASPLPGFVQIGAIEEGQGVLLASARGRTPVSPRAFDHFAK